MILNRTNKSGQHYNLIEIFTPDQVNKTQIVNGQNSIIVDAHIDDVSQAWYNWQMRGQYIQEAFPFLSRSAREFIMTGITEEKWTKLFGEKETE